MNKFYVFTSLLLGIVGEVVFGGNKLHFSVDNNGHSAPVRQILVDEKRNEIITISEDKSIGFWGLETFEKKEIIHVNEGNGRRGVLYDAEFTPDSNFLVLAGLLTNEEDSLNYLKIFNLNSKKVVAKINLRTSLTKEMQFSPDGKLLYVSGGDNTLEVLRVISSTDLKHVDVFSLPFELNDICQGLGEDLYLASQDGNIYKTTLALIKEGKWKSLGHHYKPVTSLSFSKNKLISGGEDYRVNLYDSTGRFESTLAKLENPVSDLGVSSDGKMVIAGEENSGKTYFISIGEKVIVSKAQELDNTVFSTSFLSNSSGEYGVSSGGNGHEVDILNPASGAAIKRLGNESTVHSSIYLKDNRLYFSDMNNASQYNEYFDLEKLKVVKGKSPLKVENKDFSSLKNAYTIKIESAKISLSEKDGRILSWHTDERFIYIGTDYKLLVFDKKGERILESEAHLRGVRSLLTAKIGRQDYLISSGEDELIKFWKVSDEEVSSEPHLEFYLNDEREWVLWSNLGYFCSSEQGANLVGFQTQSGDVTGKFVTLDQFFDVLYKPGHIERSLLTGKSVKEVLEMKGERLVDLSDIKGASYVTVDDFYTRKVKDGKDVIIYPKPEGYKYTTSEVEMDIEVSAFDGGAGIKEVSMTRDGKLILLDEDFGDTKTGDVVKKTYKVHLLPGENKIEVFAENFQKRKSHKMDIEIECTGEIKAFSDLYVFVIGINEYQNPKNNLNYAYADAKSFADKMKDVSEGIFNKTEIISLYNADATKENIKKKFTELASRTNPNDVFVFYYAGHGVINANDPNAEYFLAPHDVIQLYDNEETLKKIAVSASDLKKALANISAQKQLILLDACHSGGAVKTLAARGAAEEKAIFQLARSSGIVLISASGTEQFATEFKQLGHGVFTYTLLEALDGKADGGSGDKKITVGEIKTFMEDRVPQTSKKYGGNAQYPTGFSSGQDFPIGVVK